ncbi:hypothetical protein [Candidatus Palauibacter sp.]|uniref:hypothetical protein n=1 Tax=Candidatus Palauibacter sp. TaxID=3101350 RepID=UPI003B0218BA
MTSRGSGDAGICARPDSRSDHGAGTLRNGSGRWLERTGVTTVEGRRPPVLRPGMVLALVAAVSCDAPEPVPWVQRFPLLTSYEYPLVDSLWVLARDSFPEVPVERVNRILGREPGAPINVRFGHFSGYMEKSDGTVGFGHASYDMWAGGEVCEWHDEIRSREEAVFVSCFKHTVGVSPGYEIDVVVSGYRPRKDFEYVKLRAVSVRVP